MSEPNDCTVWALAHCTGIPYAEAHETLARLGRRPNCRFPLGRAIVDGDLGACWRRYEFATGHYLVGKRVADIAREPGRWIVITWEHALAIVEGAISDPYLEDPEAFVTFAWRLG